MYIWAIIVSQEQVLMLPEAVYGTAWIRLSASNMSMGLIINAFQDKSGLEKGKAKTLCIWDIREISVLPEYTFHHSS